MTIQTILVIFNTLISLFFPIHLLIKFKNNSNRYFLFFWIAFWVSLAIYNIIALIDTISSTRIVEIVSSLADILMILNPIFLGISSEYLVEYKETKWKNWIKWLLFLPIVFIAIVVDAYFKHYNFSNFILNYFCFMTTVIFGGRYLKVVNKKMEWIVVLIYCYASMNLLLLFRNIPNLENNISEYNYYKDYSYYLIVTQFFLPLKIFLYIAGYFYLSDFFRKRLFLVSDTPTVKIEKGPSFKVKKKMPEPNVEVSLSGIWGITYLIWKYRSGKVIVTLIVLSFLIAIFSLITNLSVIKLIFGSG